MPLVVMRVVVLMPFGHDAYVVFQSEPRDYLEFRVYAWIDLAD